MKSINLVELSAKNHYPLVENWLVFSVIGNISANLFTNNETLREIDKKLLQNVNIYNIDEIGVIRFIAQVFRSNSYPTILVTVQKYFFLHLTIALLAKNLNLTIHNINIWHRKYKPKRIGHIVNALVRKLILLKSKRVIVSNGNLKKYLVSLKQNKPITIMPFKVFQKRAYQGKCGSDSTQVTVIYPGIVDPSRKNYDHFYQIALRLPNVRFILLGMLRDIALKNKGITDLSLLENVVTFDSYISDVDYKKLLSEADAIFTDTKIDFYHNEYTERYGITKDTGSHYIAAEYSLPLLTTIFEPVSSEFDSIRLAAECVDEFVTLICEIKTIRQTLEVDYDPFDIEIVSRSFGKLWESNEK